MNAKSLHVRPVVLILGVMIVQDRWASADRPIDMPMPLPAKTEAQMPKPSPAALAAARANNEFAVGCLRELSRESAKNLFVSPWAVQLALSMTWAGAKGETATELARVLGVADGSVVS